VEGAGAKAARISLRRVGAFSESLLFPADASGAYRPNPQATTKLALGSSSLKGYALKHFSLANFDGSIKGLFGHRGHREHRDWKFQKATSKATKKITAFMNPSHSSLFPCGVGLPPLHRGG
jgi:hypothetical protein